ncbi:MAG: cyclase family protein [Gammaproteobacteria bacterium]|nr:cyclase family protein [Gammaproteobacteria bacterium]
MSETTAQGCKNLAVTNIANGIFTRGVLMDIPRLKGKAWLDAGEGVTVADLEAWETKAGFKVGPGDAVVLNTGRWLRRAEEGTWQGGYPGFHASTVPWFKARDVAVVGTDGGLDVYPSGVPNSGAPVHTLVLTALGMPILDVMDLTEVSEAAAERKRWTFLLTAAPIRVPNGTGSAINAIATF